MRPFPLFARVGLSSLLVVPLISACESVTDPPDKESSTYWRAEIAGDGVIQFEGPANYTVDNRGTERPIFHLQSELGGESFRIRRAGDHLMSVGEFGVGNTLRWGLEPGTESIIATYSRDVDGVREGFLAQDGSLTITSASDGRLEGSFRFNAILFSKQVGNSTTSASSDGPPLVIEGIFAAGPS